MMKVTPAISQSDHQKPKRLPPLKKRKKAQSRKESMKNGHVLGSS